MQTCGDRGSTQRAPCDDVVRSLINLPISSVSSAAEKLRPGWGLIGYNAPTYFAFILPGPHDVQIGFERGISLADPAHLLEGDSRQVRYVPLRSASDLRKAALAELLRAAASRLT